MRFLGLVLLAAAVIALSGCEEAATGPTTADFDAQRAALETRRANRPAPAPPAATAAAAAPAPGDTAPSFSAVGRDYSYEVTGKRDPFRNFKWDRPDRLALDVLRGPLEQFDVFQLELVAVVWKTGNARALVEDPSGESYVVAEGARIGKNQGRILSINDNLMVVKETYVDSLGQETTKDIVMRMRRNEGG